MCKVNRPGWGIRKAGKNSHKLRKRKGKVGTKQPLSPGEGKQRRGTTPKMPLLGGHAGNAPKPIRGQKRARRPAPND